MTLLAQNLKKLEKINLTQDWLM